MGDEATVLLSLVKQGAQKAAVCTEPAMVALAASKASSLTGEHPVRVEVTLSRGVMKNCLAVGLPGTDRRGPDVAAALGAVLGNPEMGLEALCAVDSRVVQNAHRLLDSGRVKVGCSGEHTGVYCLARVAGATRTAEATIEGGHSRVTRVLVDGRVVEEQRPLLRENASSMETVRELTYDSLFDIVMSVNADEIKYLRDGSAAAMSFAERALAASSPVRNRREFLPDLPRALSAIFVDASADGKSGHSLAGRARLWVAAAVLARMAGDTWPVLTACGSGNQGLLTSIPILMTAAALGAEPENEGRALLLAHATNLYTKAFIGKISPLCGAVGAGAGVAASVCWLMGGRLAEVEGAAQTVAGNLFGMLCDGAKASCALKCATAAAEGVLAGLMAARGVYLRDKAGIVGGSFRETASMMDLVSRIAGGFDRIITRACC